MQTTVVVGGGVVGCAVAWELRMRGHEVLVLESESELVGASVVNAGWIVPAMCLPIPAPGVIRQSLKWMLRRDSPFKLAFRTDPAYVRWLLAFTRATSPSRYKAGATALMHFGAQAISHFDRLRESGVTFEHRTEGLLYLFHNQADADRDLEIVQQFGMYDSVDTLDETGIRALEPGLTGRHRYGLHLAQEQSVYPPSLLEGMRTWLTRSGVEIQTGERVIGFSNNGSAVISVRSATGEYPASRVVLANGAAMQELARNLGARIPVESGVGFSATWLGCAPPISRPLYLHDERVAISPFADGIRASGSKLLGKSADILDVKRVDSIIRAAGGAVSDFPVDVRPSVTAAGARPVTPDGLPVIGKLPNLENVFVAGGHGMLGVTLAPVTAWELANVIDTGSVSSAIAPFSPTRFR